MSKPGGDPTSGISLEDVLRLTKRHPACRRREAQPGSCMERENLYGDAKGKGATTFNGRRARSCVSHGYFSGFCLARRNTECAPCSRCEDIWSPALEQGLHPSGCYVVNLV